MIVQANSLDAFPLATGSVQCCITSPPYWGLRDYGTATWQGGDPTCAHIAPPLGGVKKSTLSNIRFDGDGYTTSKTQPNKVQYRHECAKCGAVRVDKQLGLEATPEEYVAHMVSVFREVWRVLRDDGTLWLNLGDSYASGGRGSSEHHDKKMGKATATAQALGRKIAPEGLKDKDLVGIPWRVAFALQADGWYLRSDIIWSKPNPMPESVTDRPTKAHEYLFLLSKSASYFYDAMAVQEPIAASTANDNRLYDPNYEAGRPERGYPGDRPDRGAGMLRPRQSDTFKRDGSKRADPIPNQTHGTHRPDREDTWPTGYRNRRTVWEIATMPYSGAHFAVFPPALIEPCVLAGSRPGDVVLDPFCGSGTTGQVARLHGRRFVGLDLNGQYLRDFALPRAEGGQTAASMASLPLFAGLES